MSRVQRKEDEFYSFFKAFSKDVLACTEAYADVIARWPESSQRILEVQERETTCDKRTDEMIELLARSFVAPFSHTRINEIGFALDDIVDIEEDVVARFELFGVNEPIPEAVQMARLTMEATIKLDIMFDHLPGLKKDGTSREKIREIRKLEAECDRVYREGLAKAFASDWDPVVVLRWTKILDAMEEAMDAVTYVASIVRIVLIENG